MSWGLGSLLNNVLPAKTLTWTKKERDNDQAGIEAFREAEVMNKMVNKELDKEQAARLAFLEAEQYAEQMIEEAQYPMAEAKVTKPKLSALEQLSVVIKSMESKGGNVRTVEVLRECYKEFDNTLRLLRNSNERVRGMEQTMQPDARMKAVRAYKLSQKQRGSF